MALRVAGKTAVVTGAGSGINLAFAKLLLKNDCNVIFADLALQPDSEETLHQYRNPTHQRRGPRAIFQKTDVTHWGQLHRLFDVAEREFGSADIVCPGAGVYEPPFSNFWQPPGSPASKDGPEKSRYATLDINITHPIRATQLAIAHFLAHKKSGVVVHISSIAAQRAVLPCPMYVASKHAISGFVRSLAALESPPSRLPRVRVNAVAPGVIKTPLWTQHPEKLKMIDQGTDEWVTPEEVAEVMLDLIENEQHVGGTILEVGKNQVRQVEAFDDPGPSGEGHTVSSMKKGEDEVWSRLEGSSWGVD